MKKILVFCFCFLALGLVPLYADGTKDNVEVLYKFQYSLDLQVKLAKGLKLNFEPELRYNEGYDKMHLNFGLTYKTLGCLYFGATYRIVIDRLDSSSSSSYSSFGMSNYDNETFHRWAFDVTYKDKIGRYTPSFRVRYNNYTDEDVTDKKFLRFKGKVDYDIRKCKFTPSVSAEAFYILSEDLFFKMRYNAGVDYKISKSSTIGLDYKFDFYLLEYKNANIFSLGYKLSF